MFQKAGDQMPNNAEIIKDTVNEFQKIQAHMKNARGGNATHSLLCLNLCYLFPVST